MTLTSDCTLWLTGIRDPAGNDVRLDDFAGNLVKVIEAINPAENTGKVEFRGTQWSARSDSAVAEGSVVKIIARDNLTLKVQPIEEVRKS